MLLQKLKNPTRYHVLQSHKRQMREYVNHKHHLLLGPPKTTFQPHSAPETVPGGRKEEDETIITTLGLTRGSNNVSHGGQSYFCSTSAPEPAAPPQISTKEASAEVVAAVEREAVSLLSSLSKPSKSKCESPERINFNTDNASAAMASASKVRPFHRS